MKKLQRIEQLESWRDSAHKRLTYIEGLLTNPVEIPTAVMPNPAQPRPFKVGDVVRLEAWDGANDSAIGHIGKIYRFDADGRVGVDPHWLWSASALTLVRAVDEVSGPDVDAPTVAELQADVERLKDLLHDRNDENTKLRAELDAAKDATIVAMQERNEEKARADALQARISALEAECERLTAERDALQARVDAGTGAMDIVRRLIRVLETGSSVFCGSAIHRDAKKLINVQPVAADERKGEQRKGKERVYHSSFAGGKYFDGERNGRSVYGSADMRRKDRRRTLGTRKDRKVSQ